MTKKLLEYNRLYLKMVAIMAWGFLILTIELMCYNPQFTIIDYSLGVFFIIFEIFVGIYMEVLSHKKKKQDKLNKKNGVREDETPMEQFFTGFRKEYEEYFSLSHIPENPKIQNDVTQVYKNIIDLQHRRLEKKGIKLAFKATRMNYDKNLPETKEYFDGKYQIKESEEYIDVDKSYYQGEKLIHRENKSRAASYTILNAKKTSDDMFICPSCGASVTKESLLDGCDYCGTKFMVDDLEEKIACFSLRDNYVMQYEKYKKFREKVFDGSFPVATIIAYLLLVFCTFFLMIDEGMDMGMLMSWLCTVFCIGGIALSMGYLAILFYIFCIFPIMQIGASITHYSKKRLSKLKYEMNADKEAEEKARKQDPLFSLKSFYSGVINKLSTVIFAETKEQANAFASGDISSSFGRYEDVIDVDVEKIKLLDVSIDGEMLRAKVSVLVSLLNVKGEASKTVTKKENLQLSLIKDAKCKTQAVCAPVLLRCEGCGRGISLVEGMTCSYCGRKVDLIKYDWAIEEMTLS